MNKYVSSYGLYSFFPNNENDYKYIHPDDLDILKNLYPYGKVLYCFRETQSYIYLSFGNIQIRVKPELYQIIKADGYLIGDTVKVLNGSSKGKNALINEMNWHYKSQKIMYELKIDGKVKSRRYWKEDFKVLD